MFSSPTAKTVPRRFLSTCLSADELDSATPLGDEAGDVWSASSNRMLARAIMAICQRRIALSGSLLSYSKTPSSQATTIFHRYRHGFFQSTHPCPTTLEGATLQMQAQVAGVVGGGDAAESTLPSSPWW